MEKTEGEPKEESPRQKLWESLFSQMDEEELRHDLEFLDQDLKERIPRKIEEEVQRVRELFRNEIEETEMQKKAIEAELEKRKAQQGEK